jgi:sodium-independent sulfate anion transporter 11
MHLTTQTDEYKPRSQTKQGRVGKAIYNVLGIDPQDRYRHEPVNLVDAAKEAIHPAGLFVEEEPTVTEWLKELKPTRTDSLAYARSLFPATTWVGRYNWRWLVGDMVAGKR